MDPNQILSTFDRENKAESPLMLQPIMEQIYKNKKSRVNSKNIFLIVSLLAICINIFGIAVLLSSEGRGDSNSATQVNEWQNIYSTLLINQNSK